MEIYQDMYQQIKDLPENKYLKDYMSMLAFDGLIMEFGVFEGHTFQKICNAAKPRPVFGFDSWEGQPEIWYDSENKPRHDKGTFKGPKIKTPPINGILVDGWFEDTVPKFVSVIKNPVAFMHIDCDLYSSTKTVFDNFKNQIVDGTIIAFDEFIHYNGFENHEYKAFNEFLEETKLGWECIGRHGILQFAMRIKG